jgi:hypothetical protein
MSSEAETVTLAISLEEAAYIGAHLKMSAQLHEKAAEFHRAKGDLKTHAILSNMAAQADAFADRLYNGFDGSARSLLEVINQAVEHQIERFIG